MKNLMKGLTLAEVNHNYEVYGKNILMPHKVKRMRRLFSTLFNPFNLILFVIIGISLWTDIFLADAADYTTIAVLSTMIILSTLIKVFQEEKADLSLRKLKLELTNEVEVIRDNKKISILTTDLTIDDLVILKMGDVIPCDLVVLESINALVDESALTGESDEIHKQENDELLMGTVVKAGLFKARVIRLASQTEFGRLSEKLNEKKDKTEFEKGLMKIGHLLIIVMMIIVPCIFLLNAITKHDWLQALLFALTVAVGLTPEMLPLIVTSCLAKGVLVLSKKKTIVKDLNVIQNLGAMDILCTDKTGTLTENKIQFKGSYNLFGEEDINILNLAYINSYYQEAFKNAVDDAILEHQYSPNFIKKDEHPYDFTKKMVSIFGSLDGSDILISKGAVDEILKISTKYKDKNEIKELDETIKEQFIKAQKRYLEQGLRILVIASNDTNSEQGLCLEGFITLTDEAKKSAKDAILSLKENGVTTKILTGDTLFNAKYICKEIGLDNLKMIEGDGLRTLDEIALKEVVDTYQVFAKLTPSDKALIVKTLKESGHTVGFMGDGVNDVLALKEADVAISFKDASKVASDVAQVILTNHDLSVLNNGVIEGRRIYLNMLKYIKSTLASNFGNIISIVIASLFLPFLPMLSFQILILNLTYDLAMAIIPWDKVDDMYLKKPKKWESSDLKKIMFTFGPLSSIFDIMTYLILFFIICPLIAGGTFTGSETDKALFISVFHTGWFIQSMWSQTLIIQVMRTDQIPFVSSMPSFKLVAFSIIASVTLTILPYTKIGFSLGFEPLPGIFYSFLIAILVMYLFLVSVIKKLYIKKHNYLLA